MGKLFKVDLSGPRVYACTKCRCHLAKSEDIVSKVRGVLGAGLLGVCARAGCTPSPAGPFVRRGACCPAIPRQRERYGRLYGTPCTSKRARRRMAHGRMTFDHFLFGGCCCLSVGSATIWLWCFLVVIRRSPLQAGMAGPTCSAVCTFVFFNASPRASLLPACVSFRILQQSRALHLS